MAPSRTLHWFFCLSILFFFSRNPLLFAETKALSLRDDPLVEVQTLVPDVICEVRYATADNFLKKPVYTMPKVFLHRSVALKLKVAADEFRKQGYRLKIFDGYRPLSVQKQMWKILPDSRYVANPKTGSVHNRGAAVDLTLANLEGQDLEMPSAFDEFSPKAHHQSLLATPAARKNADYLKTVMERAGFHSIPTEWWHYQIGDGHFPVLDVSFEDLTKRQ